MGSLSIEGARSLGVNPDFQRERNPHGVQIAVVGMGLVYPLGNNVEEGMRRLVNGENGIVSIESFSQDILRYPQIRARVAGKVQGFDATERLKGIVPSNELPYLALSSQYGLVAANEATRQAGLVIPTEEPIGSGKRTRTVWKIDPKVVDPREVVVIGGTGIGGASDASVEAQRLLDSGGNAGSEFVFQALPGRVATTVSMAIGARGGTVMEDAECATGIYALGAGMDRIRRQQAKFAVVVTAESSLTPVGFALFDSLGALDPNSDPNDTPHALDVNNGGFAYGEGAGVLVLEELSHARARGANVLAIFSGYGESSDAYHRSFPRPGGEDQKRAMRHAIAEAGGLPNEGTIYWSTHTTGTGADKHEAEAVKETAGEHLNQVVASGTKPSHGHELGASGTVESIKAIRALQTGEIPPLIKSRQLVPEAEGLYVVVNEAERVDDVRMAVVDSFGFGGPNAIAVFEKP